MPDNERYLDLTGLTQYDTKIKEVIQKDITAAWQASYSYVVGKYVVYKGVLYQCKTAHTSTSTFDTTKWDQVNLIDQAIPAIAGNLDNQLISKNIAPKYDSTKTYPTNGEYVAHNGQLYKIKSGQTATGAWDYSKWDSVTVMPQVKNDITSNINSSVTSNMADAWGSSISYEAGDYVTYNGQLYKALQGQNSGNPPDTSPLFWSAVQVMDEVAGAFPAQDAHKVFAGPISGSAATPTFRILDATDIPDLSGTYIPKTAFGAKGDLLVGTGDDSYTNMGTGSNGQVLMVDSTIQTTGIKWATLSKSDIGLSNVENTGDSDTPVSAGTDKFTTGGAYTLKTQLEEEIRQQASHYRGSFATWAVVPTTDSTSVTPHYTSAADDPTGHATPTNNDYMIVEDATGYGSTYTGTWRFIFAGEWNESAGATSKAKWTPAYKIDSDKSFKTINTTNTSAQTAVASEELVGTGSINLHKIAKTGTYSDLIGKPTVKYGSNTANTISALEFAAGTNIILTQDGSNNQKVTIAATDTGATTLSGNTAESGKAITAASYNATNRTITFTKASFVQESDLPTVEFNTDPYTGTVTTIKGMKVGTDQYNFYVPDSIAAATTDVLGSVKLGTASAGTATKTYPVGFNANQQMYVDVPWTDTTSFTITANATDGIFDLTGTNGTNAVTYALAPYSSGTASSTWVNNDTNAGKFYLGTQNPSKTTRLNYNGYLYAKNLYDNGSRVVNLADAQTLTGVKTWNMSGGTTAGVIVKNSAWSTPGSSQSGLTPTGIQITYGLNNYNLGFPTTKGGTFALTNDIPYVNMTYTAGTSGSANTTTWSYRAAGATGDPLTVTFQNITTAEINALFNV